MEQVEVKKGEGNLFQPNHSKDVDKVIQELENLSSSIQSFSKMVSEIGTGIFDGDSNENKEKTLKEKEKCLILSKNIYNEILQLQSQKIEGEFNVVHKESNPQIVKKLSKQHQQLLDELQKVIKTYQTKTKGGIVISSKQKQEKQVVLEQVQLQEEDVKKEGLSDLEKKELEELKQDVKELSEIFQDLNQSVKEQHEKVQEIHENIEKTDENVENGLENIKKATALGTLGGTVIGGVVGMTLGVVGGPVGMYAGFNIGLGVGVALSGIGTVGGMVSGYFIGKKIQSTNGVNQPSASNLKK